MVRLSILLQWTSSTILAIPLIISVILGVRAHLSPESEYRYELGLALDFLSFFFLSMYFFAAAVPAR